MKKTIARRCACRGLLGLPFAASVLATTKLAWAFSGNALAATSIELSSESFHQLKHINAGKPLGGSPMGIEQCAGAGSKPKWSEFVRNDNKARIVLVHFEPQPAK